MKEPDRYGTHDDNEQALRTKAGKEMQQKKENRRRIIFWNVAEIERQDRNFWNYIVGFDFIGLCEIVKGKRMG